MQLQSISIALKIFSFVVTFQRPNKEIEAQCLRRIRTRLEIPAYVKLGNSGRCEVSPYLRLLLYMFLKQLIDFSSFMLSLVIVTRKRTA